MFNGSAKALEIYLRTIDVDLNSFLPKYLHQTKVRGDLNWTPDAALQVPYSHHVNYVPPAEPVLNAAPAYLPDTQSPEFLERRAKQIEAQVADKPKRGRSRSVVQEMK